MLKRILFLVAIVAAAGAAMAQQNLTAGAKMVVPEKVKDFGIVAQGEQINANFVITNEGTETLEIRAVRPTCGCTVADFDKEIAPGGKGEIKAHLNTADFSGPISKVINVVTSDPREPTVRLVIKATVQPIVEVLPHSIVRFNVIQKEESRQVLTLIPSDASGKFKILSVDSEVPYLKTSVRTLSGDELVEGKPQPQYELAVELAPDAPIGPVSSELIVKTNLPKAKELPIRVYGVIRALIHVTPPQVQFGSVEAKSRPMRTLVVINNRPEGAVNLTSATVNDAAFEVHVIPVEEGRRYQVQVTVKADADPGSRDAILTLATSDADFPTIEVPIRAAIR